MSTYSAMSIIGNETESSSSSSPSTYSFSENYTTVYASSTTYKVMVAVSEGGQNLVDTAWVLKNGTVLAINTEGQNLTGSEAQELIVGVFAGFTLEIQIDASVGYYTNAGYFHSTGTSTVQIGPTKVAVTNYEANSLPETFSECGATTNLTTYELSVGTPQGASAPLVTSAHFVGSTTDDGTTSNFNFALKVTSITLAS